MLTEQDIREIKNMMSFIQAKIEKAEKPVPCKAKSEVKAVAVANRMKKVRIVPRG